MFRLKQKDNAMSQLMYVTCPSCGKDTSFTGLLCPLVCHSCNELLPDALDLHYDKKVRIVYHKDKEFFT